MNDKKIIIRNCPAYDYDEKFNYHMCKQPLIPYECGVDDCKDCTDCVIKQVIEKCKDAQSECSCKNANKDVDCFECTSGGRAELGSEILQLFDIEEVE